MGASPKEADAAGLIAEDMPMKKRCALAVLVGCLLLASAKAEVYISEAVSKNLTLHPDAQGQVHDYVIVTNNGPEAVSLAGMTLCDAAGEAYRLPQRQLAPGEQLLIYCTGKKGGAPFKLSADGETLYLKNADGSTCDTLEIPAMEANERFVDGEIKVDPGSAAVSDIRLSEVCASNSLVADAGETPDWVEIENAGHAAADLSGWYLSDNASKPLKWRLPKGFLLAAGERKVVYLHEEKVGFKLSAEGEAVVLTDDDGRTMDYVVFGAQPADTSLALEEGIWQHTYCVTPGEANRILTKTDYEAESFSNNDTGVYISEVLTANANFSNTGNRFDYIELHNTTSRQISLNGWYLSDSGAEPKKWAFPKNAFIPAKGYALIYADGREIKTERSNVYSATFKLSQDHESIFLSKGDLVVDQILLGDQYGGIACGRIAGGTGEIVFFDEATPKAGNPRVGYHTRTEAPVLSHTGGLLDAAVSVQITAPEGATIHYTLNGETPTAKSSVYSGPIAVNDTTVLRAVACVDGELMSSVVSASYLFGVPYTVPVVSLITDDKYVNDPDMGLFKHDIEQEWEYPVHVQYFEKGELKINQLASARITGGSSRKRAQRSLAVYARGALSEDRFGYNPFENRDYADVKSFTLRAGGSEGRESRFKDALLTSLAEGRNMMYQDVRVIVVYINGQFWGHYNLREKINKYSIAQWEGITDEDVMENITILKNRGDVLQGSRDDMTRLISFCRKNDLNVEENLQYVLDNIDVANWFDHTIFELITGNTDPENVRYYRVPGGKWKVCLFDLDYAMRDNDAYPINQFIRDPQDDGVFVYHEPVSALLKVPAMREMFLTRFGEILYEKFQPAYLNAEIDAWVEVIGPLIPAQHERWNTADMEKWEEYVAALRKYCGERPAKVVEHITKTLSLSKDEVDEYFGAFLNAIR